MTFTLSAKRIYHDGVYPYPRGVGPVPVNYNSTSVHSETVPFRADPFYTSTSGSALTLRYLLYAHSGKSDPEKAASVAENFGKRLGFEIIKSKQPHRQYEVWRIGGKPEAED